MCVTLTGEPRGPFFYIIQYMGNGTAKKILVSFFLVFFSTLAALLLRQSSLVEQSPAPDFRKKGPNSAMIKIFEHSDFGCPACALSHKYIKELLTVYKDGIQVNFKHYPLTDIHPNSAAAALYADCAGRQGKFWEYADILFEEQEKWVKDGEAEKLFKGYGKRLGLDPAGMEKCLADPETAKAFQLDVSLGDLKKMDATPTFFVNGKRAVGPRQLSEKIRALEGKLR